MSSPSKNSGKSAVVTGAGGGLGRDIALGLAGKGYIVFGTALSATEVQDLKEASGGRVSLTVGDGDVALCVGIRCGAISSDIKLSSQAARSIV